MHIVSGKLTMHSNIKASIKFKINIKMLQVKLPYLILLLRLVGILSKMNYRFLQSLLLG